MRHLTLIVIFNLALVACCNGNKCDDAGEGYKHLRDMALSRFFVFLIPIYYICKRLSTHAFCADEGY